MPNPISLQLIADYSDLKTAGQQIGDTLRAGIQQGVTGAMDSLRQLESMMQKLQNMGPATGLLQANAAATQLLGTLEKIEKVVGHGGMLSQFQQTANAGRGGSPRGIENIDEMLAGLNLSRMTRVYGPSGLLSRAERLTGLNDEGLQTTANVTYRQGVATRLRLQTEMAQPTGGLSPEDQLAMQLRGRRIESDVANANSSYNPNLLAAQQAQYDSIMASVAQEKLGMMLRGARIDSDVAYGFSSSGAAEEERRAAILAAQQQQYIGMGRNYIQQGGYRLKSSSMSGDDITSQRYTREAGLFTNAESITHNLQTGEIKREIQETTSMASKMWEAIAGHGSPTSQALTAALSPLRAILATGQGISSAFQEIGNQAIRLSALIYSGRRLFGAAETAFVEPIEYVTDATEKTRMFEASIAGQTGVRGASAVNDYLVRGIADSPFSLDESRQQFTAMARIAPFARQMANGDMSGTLSEFGQYQNVLSGLQVLNPGVDPSRMSDAIEGALLGQGRGLRNVVRIDPDQLAELVGAHGQGSFRDNPELLFQALQRYTQIMTPAGAAAMRENLPSVQMEHIRSTMQSAVSEIGDSGIFDAAVAKLKGVADSFLTYVESPEYQARAQAISGFLTTILNNVSDAVVGFINGLTGKTEMLKGADGVASGIEDAVKTLADASYQLPSAANLAGYAVRGLTAALLDFTNTAIRFTDHFSSNHPLDEHDRAAQLSQRLTELGYGSNEQSVQSHVQTYISSGGMGSTDVTRYKVVPAGPRYNEIQQLIDQSASYSDTALKDRMFFDYLSRNIRPLNDGAPAAPSKATATDDAYSLIRRAMQSTLDLDSLSEGFKGRESAGAGGSARLGELIQSGFFTNPTGAFGHQGRNGGPWLAQSYMRSMQAIGSGDIGGFNLFGATSDAFHLQDAVGRHIAESGFGVAQNTKYDPVVQAILYRQALMGTGGLAGRAATAQGLTADQAMQQYGVMGLSAGDRSPVLDAAIQSQMTQAGRFGATGLTLNDLANLGNVASPDIIRRVGGGPLAANDSILSMLAG